MRSKGRFSAGGKMISCLQQLPAAVSLTVSIFTAAVLLTLNCRPLYYLDISFLDIERYAGMSAEEIRLNYDALISYNQIWHRAALVFPTLPMSESGAIHFAEVKRIFDVIWILCPVSLAVFILTGTPLKRRGQRGFYKAAGVAAIAVPAVLGTFVALWWDTFFVRFHQLFFNNDYWLFDPATDPVILILPDTYFLHCAAMILVLVLAGSFICFHRSAAGKH